MTRTQPAPARTQAGRTCPICGTALPAPKPTGRPATYCGPRCKRMAEFELRRLQSRLERLEDSRAYWRRVVAGDRSDFFGSAQGAREGLKRTEADIAEATARLAEVIDATS